MKKKMNKKGFTLVEIIVVLVIIAIMAAFAVPAYTGFVDRAKQSEVLASARVVFIAAQTAGQEVYAINGTTTGHGTTLSDLIVSYSEIPATQFAVAISTDGLVKELLFSDGTYRAFYTGGDWSTSKDSGAITSGVTIGNALPEGD